MVTKYGREAKAHLEDNCPDYELLQQGEQVNVNHTTCDAGEDTRRRMYVKNVDGAFMWHCHNCGDSGYYRPRETISRIKEGTLTIGEPYKHSYPTWNEVKHTRQFSEFKLENQLWLSRYEFNEACCALVNITEDTRTNCLVLPTYTYGHEVHGYQMRSLHSYPKYVTVCESKYSYLQANDDDDKPLVIVEDLLSSYKLYLAGTNSLAMLGTSPSKEALGIISRGYNRVVLWLDDDIAGHSAMMKLSRELSPIVHVSSIINHQPKEIPFETLSTMEL